MMAIRVDWAAFGKTRWYEYAVRFLFGGAITVVAGILAKEFGPVFGGLFLAFPAIFPSSATLVEKHEKQRKLRAGVSAGHRGRDSAALDARGTALGCLGLAAFAVCVWKLLPRMGHRADPSIRLGAMVPGVRGDLAVAKAAPFVDADRQQVDRCHAGPRFYGPGPCPMVSKKNAFETGVRVGGL